MKHKDLHRISRLAMMAALAYGAGLIACDNQINVTGPTFGDLNPQIDPIWTVSIAGTLVADGASCVKATILLDGQEIGGARIRCQETGGCAELELSAVIAATEGPHTITFQVLRQKSEQDTYLSYGSVTADRAYIDLNLNNDVMVNLEHRRAVLQQGEGITYEFDLEDF